MLLSLLLAVGGGVRGAGAVSRAWCGGDPEAMAPALHRDGQSFPRNLTELSTQSVFLLLPEAGFHTYQLQGKHEINTTEHLLLRACSAQRTAQPGRGTDPSEMVSYIKAPSGGMWILAGVTCALPGALRRCLSLCGCG